MHIPCDGEIIKYLVYSKSLFVDVLFENGYFYLQINSLCVLFDQSQLTIENVIRKYYKKQNIKKRLAEEEIIGPDIRYCLSVVRAIGEELDKGESDKFLFWAEDRLCKYHLQSQGKVQFVHNKRYDLVNSVEPYLRLEEESGIALDHMMRYLTLVSNSFENFLNKITELESSMHITLADVEYLDAIELFYTSLRLNAEVIEENGEKISDYIFRAKLDSTIKRLQEFLTDGMKIRPNDKWISLKINVMKWGVECEQMLILIERFEHFTHLLINDYLYVTFDRKRDEKQFGRYSFDSTLRGAEGITDPEQRRAYFVENKIAATQKLIEMDADDRNMESCKLVIEKCLQTIELIDFELSQKQMIKPVSLQIKDTQAVIQYIYSIHPAPKKKTDIIKILSAMYDAKMFAGEDGKPLTNKQKLMDAFGEFLGEDFSTYSASLSQAKTRDKKTFLQPFKNIEQEALRYFNAVGE